MKLAVLSTTFSEDNFEPVFLDFRNKALARGHSCLLVKYGELAIFYGSGGQKLLWGDLAEELFQQDLVIPKLSIRKMCRGDLYVLDLLDEREVRLLNSGSSILLARNKVSALNRLVTAGLPVPKTVVVRQLDQLRDVPCLLGDPPWVIKPSMGSRGRDISLARDVRELRELIDERWTSERHEILLIQEYLESRGSRPWDLRIFVLRQKIVGSMKREAPSGDFRANYSLGGGCRALPSHL